MTDEEIRALWLSCDGYDLDSELRDFARKVLSLAANAVDAIRLANAPYPVNKCADDALEDAAEAIRALQPETSFTSSASHS